MPSPRSETGDLDTVQGSDPAAGQEASATVPGGEAWIVRAVSVVLNTAAAAAGDRTVRLQATDGSGNVVWESPGIAVADDGQERISYGAGARLEDVAGGPSVAPIPGELFLPPGAVIQTATDNLQGGDDYAAAGLLVEKFATG